MKARIQLTKLVAAVLSLCGMACTVPAQTCSPESCLDCEDNASNSLEYDCKICDPAAFDCDVTDWYWATRRGCLGLDDNDPIDPWMMAAILCTYNKLCHSGDCTSLYYYYGIVVGRPLTEVDKYLLSRVCGCEYEPPPPPPPHVSLPYPMPPGSGTNEDGSLDKPSPFGPWDLPRNPFEPNWGGGGAIDLATGAYSPAEIDLSLPAPGFRWNVGRTYCAGQISAGAHYDSNTAQGWNWAQISQPEIRLQQYTDPALDLVYLIYRADGYVSFKRNGSTSGTFVAAGGAAGLVVYTEDTASGGIDTYTYYDQKGVRTVFFSPDDTDAGSAAGKLWKIIDTAGNTAYVGHASDKSIAVASGYNSDGDILIAFDTADRRVSYTYSGSTIGGKYRLETVKSETKSGGTWSSPTGVTEVAKVEYEYCPSDSSPHGLAGDLKLVTTTTPGSEANGTVVRRKHYRYWKDSTGAGHAHAIKYEVDFEGSRQADLADDSALNGTFASETGGVYTTEANLKPYAKAYFEYDNTVGHRIALTWMDGECGCSGGVDGERLFTYETNSSYSDVPGYETSWKSRTQVQRPDNTYEVHYFDTWGQALSSVVTAGNPASTSAWVTMIVRDAEGFVTETRTPANSTGYSHGTGTGSFTSSTSAGLITVYERFTSGDFDGFIQHTKWKLGTTGSLNYQASVDYESASMAVGPETYSLVSPFIDTRVEYPNANGTGSNTTSILHAFHTGDAALMPSTVV